MPWICGLKPSAASHAQSFGTQDVVTRATHLEAPQGFWGNKADIGWCVWRDLTGPTYLHIDKLKDHETMGKPTLAALHLDHTGMSA